MFLEVFLVLYVFLVAMVAFLCQGYSGLTSTSWQVSKVSRHVGRGSNIVLAEKETGNIEELLSKH